MQGEVVGLLEYFFERKQCDLVFARDDGSDEWVVADEFHAEAARAAGNLQTDASEADDAELFATQLGTLQGFFLPLGGVHGGVGARDTARHGDHESDGKLGDRDCIGPGGVHDDDAGVGGGIDVDVVDSDARTTNDAQLRRGGQQLGVDLHGGADDERVGIGEFGFKSAGTELGDLVGGDDIPIRLLLEDGEGCGRNFFSEHDLHSFSVTVCCVCEMRRG